MLCAIPQKTVIFGFRVKVKCKEEPEMEREPRDFQNRQRIKTHILLVLGFFLFVASAFNIMCTCVLLYTADE